MTQQKLRRGNTWTVCAAVALLCASPGAVRTSSAQAVTETSLMQGFLNPPNTARPMVRWWWFGPAVEKPEILRELQQMKADGIGGAELAFVYPEVVDDASRGLKNFGFLSPEMMDAVNYAQAEGRKLGLRIDVTLGSGWPYGGPATTLAEAATRLRTEAKAVASGETSVALPALKEGETILYSAVADGTPQKWSAASAKTAVSADGHVSVPAGGGERVVLFFIQSHTGQQVKRASVGAEGWVLDPFSKQAVATHLRTVGEPLVKAFGSTPPYAVFSDSLEAYGADWTPDLPTEFRKRRGYDLLPHLPELVAGGSPEADRVRHDWGRTLTELVNENYLVQIDSWAKAHNTKFRSQTYGEPAVSFSSQRLVALPEGEGPQWRAFSTLRWATSGNHVFGNNITSGETYTWLHSPVFRATPLDMKAEADIDFIMGENQLIFHGWPYSAPQVGEPGWSLYAAAVFNDHNPWHPVMPTVTNYIARMSYLMRQGKPANQVAILMPTDDAWASFVPGKVTVTGALQKIVPREIYGAILSAGYNFDFTDADAITKLGVGHPILVVPPTQRIPVAALRKIAAYKAAGGKVISFGQTPTQDDEGKPSPEITKLVQEALSTVATDANGLTEALHQTVKPDLQFLEGSDANHDGIGFIRRKLAFADIYYVVNTSNQPFKLEAGFTTSFGSGHVLNPETGQPTTQVADPKHTSISLAPYGSCAILIAGSNHAVPSHPMTPPSVLADISNDWKVTFKVNGKSESEHTLTDWTADKSTLHYSGEAVYTRTFNLSAVSAAHTYSLQLDGGEAEPGAPVSPPEHGERGTTSTLQSGMPNPLLTRPGPGMHAFYNPPVREGALVMINGRAAGALWHPPYKLNITSLLRPGENTIEIHVFNTALNAWSASPPHDYKPLIAKYGDRFQMQDLNKVKPIPSGLTGPIHIVSQESR